MATKNTKSVGSILGQSRDYWVNAAKQFIWPIDFNDLQILVPEKDLELAADDLMVSHFRAHGWHVQSVMSAEYTKPFVAPISDKPMFTTVKTPIEDESQFKCNQSFRVVSTGCKLQIIGIEKKSITLSYVGLKKEPIITSPEHLAKSLRMGVFVKI